MERRWSLGTLGLLTLLFVTGWGASAPRVTLPSPEVNSPTRLEVTDHLIAGSNETGEIGDLSWAFGASPATISGAAPEAGRPGIRRLSTSATISTIAAINTDGTLPADRFDLTFWVRVNQLTLQEVRMGLGTSTSDAPPDHGIYLQQNTAGAHPTTWGCVTRAATVETDTDTEVSVIEDVWMIIRVLRTTPTEISIDVDGTRVCTQSTNMPTVGLQFFVQIQNLEAAAKTLDVDKVRVIVEGLID